MKTFFYMGINPNNKCGVSWKIWKIQRSVRTVTTHWGPAEITGHAVVPKGRLQNMEKPFSSLGEAQAYEQQRIASKLRKGYERKPRPR